MMKRLGRESREGGREMTRRILINSTDKRSAATGPRGVIYMGPAC